MHIIVYSNKYIVFYVLFCTELYKNKPSKIEDTVKSLQKIKIKNFNIYFCFLCLWLFLLKY
jgi:hypothetical protein